MKDIIEKIDMLIEGDFDFHHNMTLKSGRALDRLSYNKKNMDKDLYDKKRKSAEKGSVKHFSRAASLQMGPDKEVVVPSGQKKRKVNESYYDDDNHDEMRAKIKTLQNQINHLKSINPSDPQLKNMRKEIRDLRMKLKGLD